MSNSIDFRGKDGVLGAYEAADIQTWAVFNKKNIMQAGEGADTLTSYLELMEQHNSRTTYTLCMYRNADPNDITNKSECHSSFCFQLCDGMSPGYSNYGGGGGNFAMLQKIASLEQKLKDAEKPKEDNSIGAIGSKLLGTVLGWLEDPDDIVKLVGCWRMIRGQASQQEILQTVSALGNVEPKRAADPLPQAEPAAVAGTPAGLTPEQEQALYRYAHVIERGEKADPEFLLHMEGLVKLAEENPGMYKIGLGFLK